jgi:hypothetical protein
MTHKLIEGLLENWHRMCKIYGNKANKDTKDHSSLKFLWARHRGIGK